MSKKSVKSGKLEKSENYKTSIKECIEFNPDPQFIETTTKILDQSLLSDMIMIVMEYCRSNFPIIITFNEKQHNQHHKKISQFFTILVEFILDEIALNTVTTENLRTQTTQTYYSQINQSAYNVECVDPDPGPIFENHCYYDYCGYHSHEEMKNLMGEKYMLEMIDIYHRRNQSKWLFKNDEFGKEVSLVECPLVSKRQKLNLVNLNQFPQLRQHMNAKDHCQYQYKDQYVIYYNFIYSLQRISLNEFWKHINFQMAEFDEFDEMKNMIQLIINQLLIPFDNINPCCENDGESVSASENASASASESESENEDQDSGSMSSNGDESSSISQDQDYCSCTNVSLCDPNQCRRKKKEIDFLNNVNDPNFCRDLKHLESIKFQFSRPIVLMAEHDYNTDHRGFDHTLIELDWYEKWNLGSTFTFREFVDGIYRLKSHKWDRGYERFSNVEFSSRNHINKNMNKKNKGDDVITLKINFNNGS